MSLRVMVDLFSGTGGASEAFHRSEGWKVYRYDNDPQFALVPRTHVGSVHHLDGCGPSPIGGDVDFLWASPPCTEFSRENMPWCKTGVAPDLSLYFAALEVIRAWRPRFWIIENVHGAQPWIGRCVQRAGPFLLWGFFPEIPTLTLRSDLKQSSAGQRPDKRAAIPYALSESVLWAVEQAMSLGDRDVKPDTDQLTLFQESVAQCD